MKEVIEFIMHPNIYLPCYVLTILAMLVMVFWHDGNLARMFRMRMTLKQSFTFGCKILGCILIWGFVSLFWFVFMPVFIAITLFQYAGSFAATASEEPAEEVVLTPAAPEKKHRPK